MIAVRATAGIDQEQLAAIERIHQTWNEGVDRKDADMVAALYAEDAVLESPLVRHLLGTEEGIVTGRKALYEFLKQVFARTPPSRRVYHTGFFTDGRTALWEYPRATPEGEQMGFVEVMEIEGEYIKHHKVYWGWYGVKILEQDRYRR